MFVFKVLIYLLLILLSIVIYAIDVYLGGGGLQARQVLEVELEVVELQIDVEHIVPRLAGHGIRLQLGHIDIRKGLQRSNQCTRAVVGLEVERTRVVKEG